MSQSVVTVRLNGTPYQIGCGAGEEDHVAKLGSEVEAILQDLISAVGQIGEARLLAMVTLILADKASDAAAGAGESDVAQSSQSADATGAATPSGQGASQAGESDAAAAALESAAEKIAALASTLATRASTH